MNKTTLSVVMTNYNHAFYLTEAIYSILNQSFKPIEFIIIDDASTDNSVEILKAFVEKYPIIHLIRNENNMGAAYNVDRLVNLAKGDYIFFLSADDKVLPGLFEKSMHLLEKYPQAGLCFADILLLKGEKIESFNNHIENPLEYMGPEALCERLKKRYFLVVGHTAIYDRQELIKAGGFSPRLKWNCDWFAAFVIAFRKGVCFINEPLAIARVLPNSYCVGGMKRRGEQIMVLNELLQLLKMPQYKDVIPLFKKSMILYAFRPYLVDFFLKEWKHLDFVDIRFVVKEFLSRITPSLMKDYLHSIYNNKEISNARHI